MPRRDPLTQDDYDVAVPGESLTGELGAKPYEQPPQLPTVEENISFYMQEILNNNTMPKIAANLERGRRVSDFAEFLVVSGVAAGRHTIDVGVLILPVVMEMVALIGDIYEIEYDMGLPTGSDEVESHFVDLAISITESREDIEPEFEDDADIDMAGNVISGEMNAQPQQAQEPAGLMARR